MSQKLTNTETTSSTEEENSVEWTCSTTLQVFLEGARSQEALDILVTFIEETADTLGLQINSINSSFHQKIKQ